MINQDTPQQNHLLGALPLDEYKRLFFRLERVPMPLGEVLYEPGKSCVTSISPRLASCPSFTSWRMARQPKSPWSATKASSVSPSLWVAEACRIGPLCGTRATLTGCGDIFLCRNSITRLTDPTMGL